MYQVDFAGGQLHIAAVAGLLQYGIGIEILGFEMIRVAALVGDAGHAGHNGILGISLIGPPDLGTAAHGDTVVIARAALGAHDVVILASLGQVRGFDTAAICSAAPHPFGVTHNLLLYGIVLHHANGAGLLIAQAGLPLQRNNIFLSVVVMEDGSVKAGGVQIHRLTPRASDILGCDEKVVHIKVAGIHGVHHTIDHIE